MSNKNKCKESEKKGKINFKSPQSVLDALKNLFKIPSLPGGNTVDPYTLAFLGGNKPGLSPEKIAASIINRKSGELVHEVTKDLKSDNFEKDISFYNCS